TALLTVAQPAAPPTPPVVPAALPIPATPITYGRPTVGLAAAAVQYGENTVLSGTTKPGVLVNVYGFTAPSTRAARLGQVRANSSGVYTFTGRYLANTSLYVIVPRLGMSPVVRQGVRAKLNLTTTKTASNSYAFTGSTAPRRPGQLVTIYFLTATGKAIFVRTYTDARGNYRVSRRVKVYDRSAYTVFAHLDSGVVLLGNNSAAQRITISRP
ncbi:MAG: hypothetical protein ABIM89_01740, partial [Mycobacteriales bacterium]